MNEKIKNHIDMLFEDAPKTRKAFELKEELLTNSEERYQDLIAGGVSSEDAIKNVINSIGNVSELFQGLEDTYTGDNSEYYENAKKSARIKAIAIGIYIFSVVILLTFSEIDSLINSRIELDTVGLILMILIDIIPTCMLVYISSIYPKYKKQEDTVVEDFKEWKSESFKNKSIKSSINVVLWTATVLLYFAISFATFAWYSTWIIFLIALCVQAVIELLFKLKELK